MSETSRQQGFLLHVKWCHLKRSEHVQQSAAQTRLLEAAEKWKPDFLPATRPLGMGKPQTLIRSGRNIISALAGFIPKGEAIPGYTPNSKDFCSSLSSTGYRGTFPSLLRLPAASSLTRTTPLCPWHSWQSAQLNLCSLLPCVLLLNSKFILSVGKFIIPCPGFFQGSTDRTQRKKITYPFNPTVLVKQH